MKSFTNINPVFSEEIQIIETTDPAHADNVNAAPMQLLANTQVNKDAIEALKTSTGNTPDMVYDPKGIYKIGDYCIYNNKLYKCISAIEEAEEWNKDHWEETTMTKEFQLLNNKEVEVVDPTIATEVGFAADAKLTGDALREVSAKLHPVGSIYMSVNDSDPALLFGGEWERIEGRFLLAASSTYKAGATGGEATHKLTVAEMPSHTHQGTYYAQLGASGSGLNVIHNAGNRITTSSTGGNGAHNNMPPYLVVYMWRRVA